MKRFREKVLHMRGERGSALDLARGRIVMISAIFVIAYIVVSARVVDLSLIQGDLQNGGSELDYALDDAGGFHHRADIVDRNGVLLARSLKTASLYADPKLVTSPEEVAAQLAEIFSDLTYGDILKKLQDDGRFVWIKRNLTPQEQQNVLYIGSPGLSFKSEDKRIYPQGSLTAHVVGYTSVDGKGIAGVESSFDKLLTESDKPLELTMDVRLQHALRRELAAAVDKYKAIGGGGVIMDVRNGEVLALTSLPDFDPHHISKLSDAQKFNKMTLGEYELGSVFKIFSVAAYLDSQKNPMRKSFDAREPLKRKGIPPIRDYHAEDRILSLPEVFVHSSNIGTALMAEQMGTQTVQNYYRDFGLVGKASLEIPEVATTGFRSDWRDVDTLSASFGHAIAVTPLQLALGTATVVNGGEQLEPTLIMNPEKPLQTHGNTVIEPQTAHRMRQLMRLNVTKGSGGLADIPGLQVGGKTGTAEKASRGGYDRDKVISSFVAAFPMDEPRYVVLIMLDEPKGTKETHGFVTAGWNAAPAVGNVIKSTASILGMAPEIDREDVSASLVHYVKTEHEIREEANAQSH